MWTERTLEMTGLSWPLITRETPWPMTSHGYHRANYKSDTSTRPYGLGVRPDGATAALFLLLLLLAWGFGRA